MRVSYWEGVLLTELTLESRCLGDLVNPHHGSIADIVQNVRHNINIFLPRYKYFYPGETEGCYSRFVQRVRSLSHQLEVLLALVGSPGAPGGEVGPDEAHGTAVTVLSAHSALLVVPGQGDGAHRRKLASLDWRHDQFSAELDI